MKCVCAASFSRKAKLLPLKGALQEKELPHRESRHFLWETKPGNITSNIWLPLVPAAAEKQQAIFFPPELSVPVLSIPCSSSHGKNETLGSEVTGFLPSRITDLLWKFGLSVLILAQALWSPRERTNNTQYLTYTWYRNWGLLWQRCREAKALCPHGALPWHSSHAAPN